MNLRPLNQNSATQMYRELTVLPKYFLAFLTSAGYTIGLLITVNLQAATTTLVPAPPKVNATSYILYEPKSDHTLVDYRSDVRLPPASLTKIMTSYIAASEITQGKIDPGDLVPISVNAWRKGGSRMYVQEGTKVTLSDLLKGIIIQSGNDASIAVAEYIAGDESAFADLMNLYAKNLDMWDTHFSNATGWPAEDHYTTAQDLVTLTAALIQDFPKHYAHYSLKEFTYNNIRQQNRNLLLWRDSSVDGVKTGHTEEAGYCLVSSAIRGGMRLIAVVLGADSDQGRTQESQKLLTYGFRFFETVLPYEEKVTLHSAKVWMGTADTLALGLAKDLYITIPRGKGDQLKAEVNIDRYIKAPVYEGDAMGSLVLNLEGEMIAERPLIALQPVQEANFFKRIWHWLYLTALGWLE